MKVLFIYPKFSTFSFWNYVDVTKLVDAKYPAAPLGLITVAALLPQEWEMKLIDMNTRELDESLIDWADIVMIGGMLPQQNEFLQLIDIVHAKGKKVVAGGPDPTSQPDIYKDADYLVMGEAENTIGAFIDDFANGVPGGIYKSETKPDITTSPIPRFDLLNFEDYIMIGIQFCRGCPYNCEFCDIIELFGRTPRVKTPEQIILELETLYNSGYRGHIDFVDDNFIGNKKHSIAVLRKIKEWSIKHKFPFYFSTEASINLADDDEMLSLMRDLDFRYVFLGIESADPEVLQAAQKKQNVKRTLFDDLDKIHSYGIVANGGFIIGFDNESSNSARLMAETIKRGNVCMSMIGLLVALPNTQLTRRLQKENRLFSTDRALSLKDKKNMVDQASSGLNFITSRPRADIIKDYIYVINQVYDTKNYFERVLNLCKILNPHYKYKPSFKVIIKYAKAFFRVSGKLGFQRATAKYYWKNIGKLLFTKPSTLETAVNNMALFIHFNKQKNFITEIMQENLVELDEIGEENFYQKMIAVDQDKACVK